MNNPRQITPEGWPPRPPGPEKLLRPTANSRKPPALEEGNISRRSSGSIRESSLGRQCLRSRLTDLLENPYRNYVSTERKCPFHQAAAAWHHEPRIGGCTS